MNSVFYYRTWNNGKQSTHLSSHADYAICGMDLVGDDTIHDKTPEALEGKNHRVTCSECQLVINAVVEHLKRGANERIQKI